MSTRLPPARSYLERLVSWVGDPDRGHSLADVLEHLTLQREISGEDDDWDGMEAGLREILRQSHERGQLTNSDFARCLEALGDPPLRRETIPEH